MNKRLFDSSIKETIVKYGRDIICSDDFLKTFEQTHHKCMTVGDHTLSVTAVAVRLCRSMNLNDDTTLRNVIMASLCHDLGIMGRHEKYRNNAQCFVAHPVDSVEAYRTLTGKENERIVDSISCHMFPLRPLPPRYKEGWILTMADKISAVRERLGKPPVSREERDEILAMAADMV
jgi:uncharacterized protein